MKNAAVAYTLDEHGPPLEAIGAYEDLIREAPSERNAYLNLSALYFMLGDYGFSAAHQVPKEVVEKSYANAMRILELAERRFPGDQEILAWKAYLPFVTLGKDVDVDAFRVFAAAGAGPLPFVVLLPGPDGARYRDDAASWLHALGTPRTARDRYLKSTLEAAMRQLEWRMGNDPHPRKRT